MIYLGKLLVGVSNWYAGLPNRVRLLLASFGLVLLLGLSCYKLFNSWQRLAKPLPKADPQQIIQPLQEIFHQVKGPQLNGRQTREFSRLDSLLKATDLKRHNQP